MALEDILRRRLGDRPEVRLAVLFGSAARGQVHPASDIDLGVDLAPAGPEPPPPPKLEVDLARATGRLVHLVDLRRAPPLLRFEIARDGVLLVERQPYAWADFKARAMLDWWDWAPYARRIHAAAARRLREEVARGPA